MELVLATHNLHKVRELKAMFKHMPHLDLLCLLDFPQVTLPPEIGNTFAENAAQKAIYACNMLNKSVLADDSGLVVPLLNGAPGVFSSRYAGKDASDGDNCVKLLQELKGKTGLQRSAYFECCIALAQVGKPVQTVRGLCEGVIAEEERGSNGFGYDTIFIKHDYYQTFGELKESIKNRISHRRKALDKMLILLESVAL